MAKRREYNADSITVYSQIDGVRKHPSMYLGDIDANGSLQCFKEVLQNAVDEMRECGGGNIRVVIKNGLITVADEGRGIPTEIHPKTKKSTLETVMTRLHAGGKAGNKTAYGGNTLGVHGVGASVVNALSDSFCVWSYRVKKWWRLNFEKGVVVKTLHQAKPPFSWKQGTIVAFKIDSSILKKSLEIEHARQLCSLARYFSPVDIDYEDDKKKCLYSRKEPSQLLANQIKKENLETFIKPIVIDANGVRLVACWTNATDTKIDAYVSGGPVASGTHVQGLEAALNEAISKISARDAKKCSNPLIGLRATLDVAVDQPSFAGQAKTNLRTASAKKQVIEAVVKSSIVQLKKQKQGVSDMLAHASRISKLDEEHAERKKLAKIADTPKGKMSFPKGFVAALNYPPERREVFLVEGNSAAGNLIKAKQPWQEVLPLRGKMANVINKKAAIGSSEVVGNILQVIGYDPNNKKPLRVGKVLLMADADDDGHHVIVLLLTIIQRAMPQLLKEGRVFIVNPPLFEAMSPKGEMVAGNNLEQMEAKYGKLTSVNRMKGLGGCTVPLLKEVATDPNTRKLLQLDAPSDKEVKGLVDLMGADSATRKKLVGNIKDKSDDNGTQLGKRQTERRSSQRKTRISSKRRPTKGVRDGNYNNRRNVDR